MALNLFGTHFLSKGGGWFQLIKVLTFHDYLNPLWSARLLHNCHLFRYGFHQPLKNSFSNISVVYKYFVFNGWTYCPELVQVTGRYQNWIKMMAKISSLLDSTLSAPILCNLLGFCLVRPLSVHFHIWPSGAHSHYQPTRSSLRV